MVYERVEKLAQSCENEGGMVGAGSKPVVDVTKGQTSHSKLDTNI